MIKEQIKYFVKEIHLGDLIRVTFAKGVFKDRTMDYVGYISEINPYAINLTCNDPIENPPTFLFSEKEIMYKAIIDYKVLPQDEPAPSK